MRDLARFYFGFSVPIDTLAGAADDRSRASHRPDATSACVARRAAAAASAWWRGLVGESAPRIMALLPFIDMPDRPADLPAFVISPPLADPTPPDVAIFAARMEDGPDTISGAEILGAPPATKCCSRSRRA